MRTSILKCLSLCLVFILTGCLLSSIALAADISCWFVPGTDAAKAKAITDALSQESKLSIKPKIASNYPELFISFPLEKEALVYAGSFAGALLQTRGQIVPLAQKIDGKEFYSGVMIYPKNEKPETILTNAPAAVAFAIGASSGESSAKAATGGKAAVGVQDHLAAASAVISGKAKAAFVKNYWWESNKDKFPELSVYEVPLVSEKKNPDNILMASISMPSAVRDLLIKAAVASKDAFGATEMKVFDIKLLDFSIGLMKKGGIDPNKYAW